MFAEATPQERQEFERVLRAPHEPHATQLLELLAEKGCRDGEPAIREALDRITTPKARTSLQVLYARCLLQAKTRAAEVIPLMKEVLASEPNHPGALSSLGYAHFQLGQDEEAIEIFQTAIKRKPSADLYVQIGFLFMKLAAGPLRSDQKMERCARLERSEDAYRRAIALAPHHPMYHSGLADILAVEGQVNDAIAEYSKAIELVPSFEGKTDPEKAWLLADSYVKLGRQYARTRDWAQAEQYIRTGVEMAPNARAREHLEMLSKPFFSMSKERFFDPFKE